MRRGAIGLVLLGFFHATAVHADAPDPGKVDWIAFGSKLCKPEAQQGAGFKGYTIPLAGLLAKSLAIQPDFEMRDFSFLVAAKSSSAALLILMDAYVSEHRALTLLGKQYAPPTHGKLDQDTQKLAADVDQSLRDYLIIKVFDNKKERFAIDPNGAAMDERDWQQIVWRSDTPTGIPTGAERADWLLWHLANGETYQIGCRSPVEKKNYSAVQESRLAGVSLPAPEPTEDVTIDTKEPTPTGSLYVPQPTDRSSWHMSGERDDLALSAFGLSDPLVTSPSFGVDPASKSASKPTASSYNISAQGTLGYTLLQRDCGYNNFPFLHCTTPYQLNLFADAFYGADKNAPKNPGGTAPTIDRFGLGTNFAVRLDPDFGDASDLSDPTQVTHRWAIIVQAIPEFVSDSDFESKTFYFEMRADLLGMPKVSCFGNTNVPFPQIGLKFHCGIALIGDYAHNFKSGTQPSLYNNFFRIGGEVGASLAQAPGFCDDAFCTLLTNRLGLSGWYKVLVDASDNHASVHNFTAQLSYAILGGPDGGKGVALTAKYTDGVEDITLYKLPTWSIGVKAGL